MSTRTDREILDYYRSCSSWTQTAAHFSSTVHYIKKAVKAATRDEHYRSTRRYNPK